MVNDKIVIRNLAGLHLKPAGILCQAAMPYKSMISLRIGHRTVNAKSVLGLLGACVKCGDEVEFICEGVDEQEALSAMLKVVKDGLGE